METDETNPSQDPAPTETRLAVGKITGARAAHPRSAPARQEDALDAWRESLGEGRAPPDPVRVHGFDVDAAEPDTRAVIETFSDDLARLHAALEAAEARLKRAERARRYDPRTGLLRRDALVAEAWHLEALDRREGTESTIALFLIEGMERRQESNGWAWSETAMEALGRVLAEAASAAEPAGRIHDTAFAALLTGLGGARAAARAAAIAGGLAMAVDTDPALVGLRPGRISVGQTALHAREEPYDAFQRARDDARRG